MDATRPAPSGALSADTRNGSGDPLTGRLLDGRYRIGPRIARGGMASVYRAVDERLDRVVAVKVMHPGLGDDRAFAERFQREARHAARLSHPNVVGVHDQGEDGGVVYLAMEYVEGHTLRDVIRAEGPLGPGRALALLEPVLAALAAAHRAQFIHRDVKPENVLIADDGRVKVADFGLAKAVSADTQHTVTGGVLIGTVSYLAPELVTSGRADARADVYAAGVMLYELLTGQKPHEGETPIAVAYKHVHEDVPAPSALRPVPDYVDALVARATCRDPAARPADAGVMLHQVHRVLAALNAGVVSDPDLVADLRPPTTPQVTTDTNELELTLPHRVLPVPSVTSGSDHEYTQDFAALGIGAASSAPVRVSPTRVARTAEPPARRPVVVRARGRRRGPLLLLLALLLAVGLGVGSWWFGWARYTTTPGLGGLTRAAAQARLDTAGLKLAIGHPAYSETVPTGLVVTSDPGPGTRVLRNGTVTIVLSLGKERYAIPQVAGKTVDQAQDLILQAHLAFGHVVGRWNETVPTGTVLGSTPKAGVKVKPGTSVDLVVSKGPKPIPVKDWTGRSAARAVRVLTSQGLQPDTSRHEFSDSVPRGRVISQTPATGPLHRGDTVDLVVSDGPQLVAVPDGLVAMGVKDAVAALEAAGFRADVRDGPTYLGLGYVMSVDPGSGTMLPKGSTVTLYLV